LSLAQVREYDAVRADRNAEVQRLAGEIARQMQLLAGAATPRG
jgi:hypothetical protein